MGLKLLCAGCTDEQRASAETEVRRALGERARTGDWSVSLVRVGRQWSITLDAPKAGVRSRTFVAPLEGGLAEAILEALENQEPAASVAPGAALPERAGEKRQRTDCENCGKAFVVVYEAIAGEPELNVPVACPHCWQLNRVRVGENAAGSNDYRAEKA